MPWAYQALKYIDCSFKSLKWIKMRTNSMQTPNLNPYPELFPSCDSVTGRCINFSLLLDDSHSYAQEGNNKETVIDEVGGSRASGSRV